jgi:hypothetical protein
MGKKDLKYPKHPRREAFGFVDAFSLNPNDEDFFNH